MSKTLILLAPNYQAGAQWTADHAQGHFTAVITYDNFDKLLKPSEHEDGLPTDEATATIVKLYGWEDSFWCYQGGDGRLRGCMALIRERAGGTMPIIYNDSKELRSSAYRAIKGRKAGNKDHVGKPIDGATISSRPSLLDPLVANGWINVGRGDPFIRNIMFEEQLAARVRSAGIGGYIHIIGF